MKKLELVQAFKMEQENEHLAAYKKVFPHARPTIFQLELIEQTVTDSEAWRDTLIFWGGNNYRADSIFKMLEYYKEALGKKKFGKYVPDEKPYEPTPPCKYCGSEYCLKLHREEILKEEAA